MSTSVSSPATGGGEVGTAGGGVKSSYRLSLKRQSPSYDGTELGSRETWISTNKILNSSYCGRRTNSRNPNFDYDESKLLISLWGDPQVQKALITTHKKHPVIAELARKMREHGYNRSTEEINTRIKNLKCFYNRIKKDMAAGLINQTTWRHYADMDEIISRPVFGNRKKSDRDSLDAEDGRSRQSLELEVPPLPSDEPLPVKLELMSDDDDDDGGDRDDDEPTEIRAEDLLTIDASFPEEMSAAASSSSSSSGAGGSSGIAKKTYPSTASRSNGRTISDVGAGRSSEPTAAAAAAASARKGRASSNGGNDDSRNDDDDDDDDDEDDDEEDDEDDDDDGSDFDVENEFNDGLDEILLKAQSKGNSAGPKTITGNSSNRGTSSADSTANSKGAGTSGLVIENVTSGSSGTTASTSVAATAAAPPPQQQGKISVVPTNLLLKSPASLQPTSSSLSTPIQIFTKPTVSLAAGGSTVARPATMGIGTGASVAGVPGAPMKLLLVNTVGKDGTTKQILTPAGDVTNLPKLMPATTLKQAATGVPLSLASTSGAGSPIVSIPAINVPPNKVPTITGVHSLPKHMSIGRPAAPPGGTERESAGFKTLLTQLVTIQRENLALNQERLALEKERLEFETKFGGSFVSMVQNMSTFFSNMLKHQRQDVPQSRTPVAPKETIPAKPAESKTVAETKKPEASEPPSRSQEVASTQPAAPAATTPTTITSTSAAVESPAPASAAVGKHPLPAPPALTPLAVNASKPNAEDGVVGSTPLPKKRRMMTRNAAQPATSTTDDALKTEVISDNDDH